MTAKSILRKVFVVLVLVFVCLSASAAFAQTTVFTYQGKLTDSAAPQATYQMEFSLFDAVSGGTQMGTTFTQNSVSVTQGIFTVNLDFGAAVFTGADRFLQIAVRRNAGESFVTLNPRQQIASSPYSIRTLSAAQADLALDSNQLGGVAASEYVTTTTVGNSFIRNSAAQQTADFNISGNGTAAIFDATQQYNLGGSRILSAPGNLNLFAGSGAGQANTTGNRNTFVGRSTGQLNTIGTSNSFFGYGAGSANTGSGNSFFGANSGSSFTGPTGSTNSFFGYFAGAGVQRGDSLTLLGANTSVGADNLTNATAIGANALVVSDNTMVLGSIAGVNGAGADTLVGIGTTAPIAKLNVSGANASCNAVTIAYGAQLATGCSSALYLTTDSPSSSSLIIAATQSGGVFVVKGNGKVGIGDNAFNPGAQLSVRDITADGGVFGSTISPFVSAPGVYGVSTGSGGVGVRGEATTGASTGVFGVASAGTGVTGQSTSGNGVFGSSVTGLAGNFAGRVRVGTFDGGGTLDMCLNASNVIAFCSSSMRYKKNIASFRWGLSLLNRLRPVTFDWKEDGQPDVGLVAEEVAALESRLTFRNHNGEIEGVKYNRINMVLINAVKEQQEQIATLRSANREMSLRLREVERKLWKKKTQSH